MGSVKTIMTKYWSQWSFLELKECGKWLQLRFPASFPLTRDRNVFIIQIHVSYRLVCNQTPVLSERSPYDDFHDR